MTATTTPATCQTIDCTEAEEFVATSPTGRISKRLCMEHAEPAEGLGWTVTDLDGQEV